MEKRLLDELTRIHKLTYGENMVNESFIDNLVKNFNLKKEDDPKKADFLTDDVKDFFNTLESIETPITQQEYGTMTYQKNVEAIQVALTLLGYELSRFGVDGLFGKETALAVERFKKDNNINQNTISEAALVQLGATSLSNVEIDNDSTQRDKVNKALIDDVQTAAKNAGLTVTITTATSGHPSLNSSKPSRHKTNSAVDIAIINGESSDGATNGNNGNPQFRILGNKLVDELLKLGYVLNSEGSNPKSVIWQTNTGGNHFNHVHVSNKSNQSSEGGEQQQYQQSVTGTIVTPELVKIIIDKLKQRGVTSEDLQKRIDTISLDGLSDKNVYAKLLESLNAPVTEENLKFLYAWRQAEGKSGTYNPFNTTWKLPNSIPINDHGVRSYQTLEDGIRATIKTLKNSRYECIVNGLKNDIGAINISRCPALETWGTGDLVYKVLLGYENGAKPKIQSLA
jgi:peptidoglycan hydrolase-like protein with peptidoglycan-binding domain